ncbi:MAG TPA: hypothetical protein VKR57_08785 [Terriglobales bacterium]|nr:hypothetical protein [Terriglobales bacterium]
MKNTEKMRSSVGSYLSNRRLSAVLIAIIALVVAVPSHAQRATFTMPRYTPLVQTYHPPARTYHPPAQTYHPPAQTPRSAPQPTYHPPAQTQSRPAQTQSTGPRTTGSTPQARSDTTQSRQPAPSRAETQKQEKVQAGTQKEQQKQNREQQKQQARQQKEQRKQMQRQQKEQARHQKELQKQQKRGEKSSNSSEKSAQRNTAASVANATSGGASKQSTGTLPPSKSQAQIQRLNTARSTMSGINRRPLPAGELTVHSNGRMTLKAEPGRQYGLRATGTIASYSDRGKVVSFDRRGEVNSIHTANMDIHNGAHGQRTIISRRADGGKVVSTGRHSGYVERSVVANNRTYVQRTMVINNRVYTRTFLASGFGGVALVPPVFFAPGFYGWAYYPWAAPIGFTWGWFGAPWYIGPNPYFAASPLYPSAAFWLTDYMIGETLAAAYQLHNDAGADDLLDDDSADAADSTDADMSADLDSDGRADQETLHADANTPITPELKAEIAEEVKQQLANDNAEAAKPSQTSFDVLPVLLSKPNHVFVVSTDLDVTTTDQQLCALQAGDMLRLISPAASDSSFVQLRVATSKRMDCPAGVLVNVSLPDLQEMQNNFQAQIESGLGNLRSNQGRTGLPSAPPDAVAAPPRPAVSGLAPLSAADSAAMLDQARQQAAEEQTDASSL